MKNVLKTIVTVAVTAIVSVAVTVCGIRIYMDDFAIPLPNIIRIGKIIESSYVGEYDRKTMENNVINAVLESIDDKYAVYYDEENAKDTMQMLDGYYTGIGIEIFANSEKNAIEVISAYEDTPADRAGIKSGDYIVKIDGKEYTDKTLADAVIYMKGLREENPLEKEVEITLKRGDKEINVTLKRELIELYKVKSEIIDGICYIRYSGFTESSAKEVEQILLSLEKKDVSGIVVDVRNNPGGEFGSAIDMCDFFLSDEMIMYTVDKSGDKTVYTAAEDKCDLPLAIIVNRASASASEIFAGSLQANNRAVIVGEKTYGKGVSQTVRYINPFDMSDGAIKLTTCKNYTPDGRWINESVVPDINITTEGPGTNIREDAAFLAAVKSLKEEK